MKVESLRVVNKIEQCFFFGGGVASLFPRFVFTLFKRT